MFGAGQESAELPSSLHPSRNVLVLRVWARAIRRTSYTVQLVSDANDTIISVSVSGGNVTLLFLEPRVTDSSFSLNAFEVLPVQGRGDINSLSGVCF